LPGLFFWWAVWSVEAHGWRSLLPWLAAEAGAIAFSLLVQGALGVFRRIRGGGLTQYQVALTVVQVAAFLAGKRRQHAGEAWRSDLLRPRDDELGISAFRRYLYALGLIRAAIRYRLDDASALWWRMADHVLSSRFWSGAVLITPSGSAVAMIAAHQGLYGLIVNASSLIAIGGLSTGLVYGGRKARGVKPKTRPSQPQRQTPN
jgi:hypothetical protein